MNQFKALVYDAVHGQDSYATTDTANKLLNVWGAYQIYVREARYKGPFRPLAQAQLDKLAADHEKAKHGLQTDVREGDVSLLTRWTGQVAVMAGVSYETLVRQVRKAVWFEKAPAEVEARLGLIVWATRIELNVATGAFKKLGVSRMILPDFEPVIGSKLTLKWGSVKAMKIFLDAVKMVGATEDEIASFVKGKAANAKLLQTICFA